MPPLRQAAIPLAASGESVVEKESSQKENTTRKCSEKLNECVINLNLYRLIKEKIFIKQI
jgi:hypothetical protein